MDELPLVTVITPTHNIVDKDLTDDLLLLIMMLEKQTYSNIEHIIIDNASDDGTVQVLTDYKSKGYLQFYTEPDTGKYNAYNKGIMRAKGKYVIFLECSDYIHDITAIAKLVDLMEANDADYTFGGSYAIHPQGTVFPFAPAIYNVFQVMPCSLQAMCFKKSVLAQENYFDEKFKIMADYDLILRLMLKEYTGVLFDSIYVTYKIPEGIFENVDSVNNECKSVYVKNYRNIFPLTNEILDEMATYSNFPKELLNKLAEYFPEENRNDFLATCEEMHKLRVEALTGKTSNQDGKNLSETEDSISADNTVGASDTASQTQFETRDMSSTQNTINQNNQSRLNSSMQTHPQFSPKPPQMPPKFQ